MRLVHISLNGDLFSIRENNGPAVPYSFAALVYSERARGEQKLQAELRKRSIAETDIAQFKSEVISIMQKGKFEKTYTVA